MKPESVEEKPKRVVKKVQLSASWGYGCNSDICMPLSKWKKILEGMEFVKGGWSWYDGERYHVSWSFNKSNSPKGKGTFTISSNDGSGRECIRDAPLSEIRVFHYE